ncbi:hypothetical protein [Roseomonas haemaphysalidis]|uniref:Secreted protein n=1 Tax=Roseomonas haemaphysalidis TaxID=2768162 RepID=A0ABS3KW44_9PROT|nr:hypothetical protein [Roseomonas haemaphysalidis]MBO1081700.1 hypothetical protein [Roseomonas haemaphysalidis]
MPAIAAATMASVAWPGGPARATPPAASAACGDLLAEAKRKPAGLVFIGCMALRGRQVQSLRASH